MTWGVPDGFMPYKEPSPFPNRVGPLHERDNASTAAAGFTLGLLVLEHHCNRRGFAHGGLLVTLADVVPWARRASGRATRPPRC